MIAAVIQSRMGSTRLPGKTMLPLCEMPLLQHVVLRAKACRRVDEVVIATTLEEEDNIIADWATENGVLCVRGSKTNLIERFYEVSKLKQPEYFVRITADDPFKDPDLIDKGIEIIRSKNLDFVYNNRPPSFPEGLDVEVFTAQALRIALNEVDNDFDREHLTQFFYRNKNRFKQLNFRNSSDLSHLRWTIDTIKDFEMVSKVYQKLYKPNEIFLMKDILNLLSQNSEIEKINMYEQRSAMYESNILP